MKYKGTKDKKVGAQRTSSYIDFDSMSYEYLVLMRDSMQKRISELEAKMTPSFVPEVINALKFYDFVETEPNVWEKQLKNSIITVTHYHAQYFSIYQEPIEEYAPCIHPDIQRVLSLEEFNDCYAKIQDFKTYRVNASLISNQEVFVYGHSFPEDLYSLDLESFFEMKFELEEVE